MRILVDERRLDWDEAWRITVATFGYTNHTLLPEALEKWPLAPVPGVAAAAPRDHLRDQQPLPRRGAGALPRRRRPGAAHVDDRRGGRPDACAWRTSPRSAATPSTASRPCTPTCSRPACSRTSTSCGRSGSPTRPTASRRGASWPCPTRACAGLLDRTIGDGWLTDLDRLRGLEAFVDDPEFRQQWRDIKRANKSRLADYLHVHHRTWSSIPRWMFDIQVKRIHEYKRQHLSVLHIIRQYHRLKQNPGLEHRAARLRLRRQGGPRLLHGQANHQADQRRRRDDQQRPRRQPVHEGGVRTELQRAERTPDLPGGRTCPSRSRPRARKRRAPGT